MLVWLDQAAMILAASALLRGLALAVPVAITVAALAGWRNKVPGTVPLAIWGALLSLWLFVPIRFAMLELRQMGQMLSILGWLWLVGAWGRLVLGELPSPIWGHWIVGTLLLALGIAGIAVVVIG